ncbi:hypothetical protein TKK_0006924 [Trichogramma kaykai]
MKIPIIGKPLEISLKLTGFWSDKVNKVVLALMWSSVLTTMPFSVWDAIRIRKNPLMLFDNLSVFLAQVLLYSKLLIFSYNRRLLRNLLREMENDFQSDPQLLRYIELSGNDPRRFCKYEFFVYLGASALFWVQIGFVYVAVPVEMREAVFKVYYPFDYKSSPVYEVLVLTQIIQGMLQCCIQAFSESLLIALVSYVCAQIDTLFARMEEFSKMCVSNDKRNLPRLSQPVYKQHIKVLTVFEKLNKIYFYVTFFQVFFTTVIICLSGFVVIVISDDPTILVKFAGYYFCSCWQIFSFCLAGQRLLNKSDKIAMKMYETIWYKTSIKEIHAVAFIIKRSQKPLMLSVAKSTELSMVTFTQIMKTSFSCLSVLRACYN